MQKKALTSIINILNQRIKTNQECIGIIMSEARYDCDEHKAQAFCEIEKLLDIIDELESICAEVFNHE